MYHPFSIADTIKTAWNIIKKNFITIIIYSALAVVLLIVIQGINFIFNSTEDFSLQLVLFCILLIMQGYTTLGLYKLIFTLIDSEFYEFEFSQIIPKIRMVLSYIAISLVFAFIVTTFNVFVIDRLDDYPAVQSLTRFLGVIILLYLALRYMFCVCFIVDEDSGPFESLGQSFAITRGNLTKIILVLLISIGLIALGFVALVIGIIITYPLVNIILVVTYRKLVYSHQDVDDDLSETI